MKDLPKWTRELWRALRRKEWTKKKGWRSDLAAKLGVVPPTVSRWLHGERVPAWKYRRKLTTLLDMPPEAWL